MLQKHSSILITGFCCLLLLTPFSVSAEDSPIDKGKLDWKLDRVIQDKSGEDQYHTKTELEKTLPELFNDDTTAKIKSVQREKKKSIDNLEESLFTDDLEVDDTMEDTEEALFTSDYVAPKHPNNHEDETEGKSSWFNKLLIAGLVAFGCILCGGIYMMFRKLSDQET